MLPPCGALGYNAIYTVANRTTQAIRLTPCVLGAGEISAEATAKLFFDGIVRHCGLLDLIVEGVGQQGCVLISLPSLDRCQDLTYALHNQVGHSLLVS